MGRPAGATPVVLPSPPGLPLQSPAVEDGGSPRTWAQRQGGKGKGGKGGGGGDQKGGKRGRI